MQDKIIDKNIFFKLEITETGRSTVDSHWRDFVGFFPYCRIYYIVDGKADVILTNGVIHMTKGTFYLIPAFSIKSVNVLTETLDHMWVHFTVSGETSRYIETTGSDFCYAAREGDIFAFDRILELFDGGHSEALSKNAAATGLLCYLFANFFIDKEIYASKEKARFMPVLKYIDEHLSEKLDNDELCKLVFLSRVYFSNLFTKNFQKSPKQYVQEKRMMTAASLLVSTDKPIKEIAEAVGYYDDSYFNRSFVRYTHMTPGHYRKTLGSLAAEKKNKNQSDIHNI